MNNYDLSARKWAITENILMVALIRRVSPQLVRAEIIAEKKISASLLSLLEKTDTEDTKNVLTVAVEDKLNQYFTHHLKSEVVLNGSLELQFN